MSTNNGFLLPRHAFKQLSGVSSSWLAERDIDNDPVPFELVRTWFEETFPKNTDARIFAHINLRGGIGKTTSTINLAARLSQYGRRTVLIDLDPQASATLALQGDVDEEATIFLDVIQHADSATDALQKIDDGFYLLPSSLGNGLLDVNLNNPAQQKKAVSNACDSIFEEIDADCIVIDCPPALGAAVISTICTATDIIIPVMGDPFSIRGLELTFEEISSICETFGLSKPNIHVLFNRMDRREKLIIETFEKLRNSYEEYLIPFPIRTSSRIDQTYANGETIFSTHTKHKAYTDFDAYARYLLNLPTQS